MNKIDSGAYVLEIECGWPHNEKGKNKFSSKELMFLAIEKVIEITKKRGGVVTFGNSIDKWEAATDGEVILRILEYDYNLHYYLYRLPRCGGGHWPDFDIWSHKRRYRNKVTIE